MKKLAYRIRWHLTRTPLVVLVKYFKRLTLANHIRERKLVAKAVPREDVHVKLGKEFNKNGYVEISALLDPNLMEELDRAGMEKLVVAAERKASQDNREEAIDKDFWERLLDEDTRGGASRIKNPFVRTATQPSVISLLAEVYGEIPRLDYVLLTLSKYTGNPYKISQLWHRDHDDTRVVKLFIYLTDVLTLDDGPFTFFPGPVSDKAGFAIKSHQCDKVIDARIGLKNACSMMAPKLTAFLVETSRCIHMGSRVSEGHSRLLYTATYISSPRLYPEPPPRFFLSGAEGRAETLLLTADSR